MNQDHTAEHGRVVVRRATPDMVDALVGLMQPFYSEAGFQLDLAWARASFLALLSRPELGCAWLAYRHGVPVGHAVLTVRYTMEHGALSGYVDDLFVQPEFRRQGVAWELLGELFKECGARDCKSVQVEVGQSNAAACGLYAGFGLVPHQDDRMLLSGAVGGCAS